MKMHPPIPEFDHAIHTGSEDEVFSRMVVRDVGHSETMRRSNGEGAASVGRTADVVGEDVRAGGDEDAVGMVGVPRGPSGEGGVEGGESVATGSSGWVRAVGRGGPQLPGVRGRKIP